MKRLAVVMTMLGFAVPVLADEVSAQAATMADVELDGVAAGSGHGHHHHHWKAGFTTPTFKAPNVTNNINISPIIVTQTAVALTTQNASAKGGNATQNATTTALNFANISYSVKF
jgi:hypothetical protein